MNLNPQRTLSRNLQLSVRLLCWRSGSRSVFPLQPCEPPLYSPPREHPPSAHCDVTWPFQSLRSLGGASGVRCGSGNFCPVGGGGWGFVIYGLTSGVLGVLCWERGGAERGQRGERSEGGGKKGEEGLEKDRKLILHQDNPAPQRRTRP